MVTNSFNNKFTTKILFLFLFPFLLGCQYRNSNEEKKINIVFRFDDFSAKSNTEIELKIINAFKKNKWQFTVSPIPFVNDGNQHDFSKQNTIPLPQSKGDILKDAINEKIIDIALHGYSHQVAIEQNNEFAGLSYQAQVEKLKKGKKLLENLTNIKIKTFVPPWNSYDLNTLKALEDLHFLTISADRERVGNKNSNLIFLPYTCQLPELLEAIKESRKDYDSKPSIVVMFHEYDFKEIDKRRGVVTFQEFQKLLYYLKNQKDINVLSIGQITKKYNDFTPEQFVLTHRIYMINKFLPSFLRTQLHITHYQFQYNAYIYSLIKVFIIYLILFALSIITFRFIGTLVNNWSKSLFKIGLLISIISTICLLIYVFQNLIFGQMGLILSIIATGCSVGLLIIKKNQQITNDKL